MKVIYIYQYFGTPAGSWSTRVYEFTRRWVEGGHEVTVITSPYDKSDIESNSFISKMEIQGVRLIVIKSGDSNKFNQVKRAWRAIIFALVSSYFAIKLKADVVIASSGPITVGIPGLLAKRFSGKKLVFEVRDLWPDGGIYMDKIRNRLLKWLLLKFEKYIYDRSSLIVTASDGQMNWIEKKGIQKSKIMVIYNSCDLDLFGNKNNTEVEFVDKQPTFIHLGSLGFIHNVGYIIDAAKYLKDQNINARILLIGDGAERSLLEKKVNDLSLDNVIFLGQMPKTETVSFLQKATATLFTTLDNPVQDTCSPNKIFDSMAAGKPIIQTTRGWIKELIQDNEIGINCDPVHPASLANAMKKYLDHPDLAQKHGQNANKLANEKLSRDRLSQKYLQGIKQIVA